MTATPPPTKYLVDETGPVVPYNLRQNLEIQMIQYHHYHYNLVLLCHHTPPPPPSIRVGNCPDFLVEDLHRVFPAPTCTDDPPLSVPPPGPTVTCWTTRRTSLRSASTTTDVIVENTEFDPLPDTPVLACRCRHHLP